MQHFKQDWIQFAKLVLNWRAVCAFILIAIFFWLTYVQSNLVVKNLLLFVTSLFTAVLGAVLSYEWTQIRDEGIISTRARLSIRHLVVSANQLYALEKRVDTFIERESDPESQAQPVSTWLEEIAQSCANLNALILSSTENWSDIVPGADLKGMVTELREAQSAVDSLNEKTQLLQSQLQEETGRAGQDSQTISRLEKEVADSRHESAKAEQKLRSVEQTAQRSVLGGLQNNTTGLSAIFPNGMAVPSSLISSLDRVKACNGCNAIYPAENSRVSSVRGTTQCPYCKRIQ